MRLLLVRHGQTSWNISGRAQGHTDIPLDPTGQEQAGKLGQAFLDIPVDRVLTSDLSRSFETARPIAEATGAPLESRKDLRERGFGEWEGTHFTEVETWLQERAFTQNISRQQIRPPGGESFEDVWERLEPVYQSLLEAEGSVVVVSHGGALSLLLAKLVRGTLDTSRSFRFANTGVTELHRRPEGLFAIIRYNDATHLASEQPLIGSLDGISR